MGGTGIYSQDIHTAIERMASEIYGAHQDVENLVIVGVAKGGVEIARRLHAIVSEKMGRIIEFGVVDITFHRDDIMLRPITADSLNTAIDIDLDDAAVVLVDDVLFSGRTIRAALNECFDQGRPDTIELAVLVDREPRKLPITARYIGFHYEDHRSGKLEVKLDSAEPSKDIIQFQEEK
ncbi:MAG: bifunctional pyr operon transcriptional regulator/uracil phosphoribosyltransferase PyrR [Verrucomicrobiota bacterium]